MEEEKFNQILSALRTLRALNPKNIDALQLAGASDLTPEQKKILAREFGERKNPDIAFENDYF